MHIDWRCLRSHVPTDPGDEKYVGRLQRAWRRRPLLPEGAGWVRQFSQSGVGAGPIAVPASLVVVSPVSSIGGPAWHKPTQELAR